MPRVILPLSFSSYLEPLPATISIMRIVDEFIDGPRVCAYLPDQQALLHYQLVSELTPAAYEKLMPQRFRKFGQLLFRPVCPNCTACQPIRVPVSSFVLDRSQTRCCAANQDLKIVVQAASAGDDQLGLYAKYHAAQAEKKGWGEGGDIDAAAYTNHYLLSETTIEEVAAFEGGQLIGVLLFEETGQGISLIYHYYDPEAGRRGLGKFLILKAFDVARQRGKDFVYLGYYVSGCKSMEYKAKFGPNEILKDGAWRG